MKRLLLLPLSAALVLFTGCESLKEWDRQIKSRPAGVGIQGAEFVYLALTVLQKYEATPRQAAAAKEEAAKVVAKLSPEQKEKLEDNPLIVVETIPDERASKEAKKSVIIFDVSTEKIVGNNVYDIKPASSEKKTSIKEEDLVKTKIDGFDVNMYGYGSLF